MQFAVRIAVGVARHTNSGRRPRDCVAFEHCRVDRGEVSAGVEHEDGAFRRCAIKMLARETVFVDEVDRVEAPYDDGFLTSPSLLVEVAEQIEETGITLHTRCSAAVRAMSREPPGS